MTSPSTPTTQSPLHVWALNLVSLACGLAALYWAADAASDKSPLLFCLALLPAPLGYGLWRRRRWGRTLALVVCWVAILSPPFLFIGALVGGWGRDSIGHGLIAVISIVWLFTLTPLAAWLLRLLTRPTTRSLFAPNDAPLSKTEKNVVSVSLGVSLLAEIVVLANVHWFEFVLKRL